MNKNELIAAIAENAGLSKTDSAKAVDAFISAVSDTLKKGDEVRLIGFGTFCVTERKATEGRNPRTGEKIQIPAAKVPKFKPGQALKDCL